MGRYNCEHQYEKAIIRIPPGPPRDYCASMGTYFGLITTIGGNKETFPNRTKCPYQHNIKTEIKGKMPALHVDAGNTNISFPYCSEPCRKMGILNIIYYQKCEHDYDKTGPEKWEFIIPHNPKKYNIATN